MKINTILSIIATIMVVAGFGMIHSKSTTMQNVSIALVGVGAIYLIFRLITSIKKDKNKE